MGRIELDKLRAAQVQAMFDAIDEATDRLGDVRANGTPDERRAMRYRKEVGPATKQTVVSVGAVDREDGDVVGGAFRG